MRLSPVKSIHFGYNKEFHQTLKQDLLKSKQNKELAKFLAEADELSLRIEDEIILMEHDQKKRTAPRFKELTRYLSDLKEIIAFYMQVGFAYLKYPESLTGQYAAESLEHNKIEESSWRENLAKKMLAYAQNKALSSANGDSESAKNKNVDELKKMTDDIRQQAVDDYKEGIAKDLLELFVPEPSSPKGFSDVVGMDDIKLRLQEGIVDYAKNPELAKSDYEDYGISMPRGFLFYGPPGCGKTYITKALALESGLSMYKLDVSKAGSKYVNQTSLNLKKAFDFLADKAKKDNKPILLFMDEVDSFAMSRGSVMHSDENMKTVSALLKLIEEAKDNNIIIIAATNKYDLLDEAFKARFDGQVYIPLPSKEQIVELLVHLLSSRKKGEALSKSPAEVEVLADMLKGYSNRSITFIVEEASKLARRNNRGDITFECVEKAIETSELEKPKEKEYKKLNNKSNLIGFN